ncbi:MAG: 50S ribosomal protein L31e [Candidatus Bathyarchaeia archaeon]
MEEENLQQTEEITKEEELPEEEVLEAEENEVAEEIGEEETVEEVLEEKEIEELPAPRPKEEEEEKFVEERIYTIPLRRAWIAPPKKRVPRAMRIIKAFVQRHMKIGEAAIEEEKEEEEEGGRIIVSNEVNEKIWSRGIEKPPRKIRIRAAKDAEGNVTIFLA